MIANKDEAKEMTENISPDSKYKFNSTTCNSNQQWNKKTCHCQCKNYHQCEKVYIWSSSTCTCVNSKYLKRVTDTSVSECDEIVIVMNNFSTKKRNTITTKK